MAAVVIELGLGAAGERLGVETLTALDSRDADTVEQRFGITQRRRADGAVQLEAERQEVVRAAASQHLQLQLELAPLRREQVAERDIRRALHRDRREACLDDRRIVLQRGVDELGGTPVVEEPTPGVEQVDGRDGEQEPDAGRDVGELVVDRQVVGTQPADRLHRSSPARTSSVGCTAAASAAASSVMWATSGSPVHSSMKTFLNSMASTHPVSG